VAIKRNESIIILNNNKNPRKRKGGNQFLAYKFLG